MTTEGPVRFALGQHPEGRRFIHYCVYLQLFLSHQRLPMQSTMLLTPASNALPRTENVKAVHSYAATSDVGLTEK